MEYPSRTIEKAVESLSRLPGIGKKTALRLALHLLNATEETAQELGAAIIRLKTETKRCKRCHNLADDELCRVCLSPRRDNKLICVVEDIRSLMALEKIGQYSGVYHVLNGLIDPLAGRGPELLTVDRLVERVQTEAVEEVILALSTSMEGETTAFFVARKLQFTGVKITNIARGIPLGSELEFADEMTLARSLQLRVPYLMEANSF